MCQTCVQPAQPGESWLLIPTWSLCSGTSSAKPLFGVGMTFARVALLGSGSYGYKKGNQVSSASL